MEAVVAPVADLEAGDDALATCLGGLAPTRHQRPPADAARQPASTGASRCAWVHHAAPGPFAWLGRDGKMHLCSPAPPHQPRHPLPPRHAAKCPHLPTVRDAPPLARLTHRARHPPKHPARSPTSTTSAEAPSLPPTPHLPSSSSVLSCSSSLGPSVSEPRSRTMPAGPPGPGPAAPRPPAARPPPARPGSPPPPSSSVSAKAACTLDLRVTEVGPRGSPPQCISASLAAGHAVALATVASCRRRHGTQRQHAPGQHRDGVPAVAGR